MKIVAIIPIKLNNERLPGKNTMLLGGKPLISYCLSELLNVKKINNIFVYCSSENIIPYLPAGVTFLKRSEHLDSNRTNFTQIFQEFSNSIISDIYIYAHATAPFVKKETIKKGLDAVISGRYDSAFCAEKIQDYLWKDGNPLNFNAQNLPRSQDLPVIFRETSGVYIFTKDVFQKYQRRIGVNPYIIELDKKESIDINTEADFKFAENMLNLNL